MNVLKKTTGWLAVALIAVGVSGCVDQEPSMTLAGSAVYEGEAPKDNEVVPSCDPELDPSSVESFHFSAEIDIGDLSCDEITCGQLVPPGVFLKTFSFAALIENQLQDSRNVGAVGQGGSGGFENMNLDQNTIQVTHVNVKFPEELNSFTSGQNLSQIERQVRTSPVIDSNGGAALVNFEMFDARSIDKRTPNEPDRMSLLEFHEQVAGAPDAIVPLVAELQVKGKTFAGTKVESNRFQFPINLCRECPDLGVTPQCTVPTE